MMKRVIRFGLLIPFLFGLVACREYFPTSPSSASEVRLSITGLDSVYQATENEPLAVGFDIIAFDETDLAVPGILVEVVLIANEGSIAIPELISNTDGKVHALYYNHQPLKDYRVQMLIILNNDTLSTYFEVIVRPTPSVIQAEHSKHTLYPIPNRITETFVTFRVTNQDGIPVPNVDVGFSVMSGNANIESVSYTDKNGLVRALVNFTPVENCQVVIQAIVRFVEPKMVEDNGNVLQFNLLKNLPQLPKVELKRVLKAESTIDVVIE